MFDLLGVRPALGRLIGEADNRARGAHPVVVIGHAFWQRRFGGRADALGQVLTLNGTPFTVIGVASPGFKGTQVALHFDVFVPVVMQPVFYQGDRLGDRSHGWLQGLARVNPGHTLRQVQAELDVVAARLARSYPDPNGGRGLRAFEMWRSPNGGQSMLMPAFAVLGGIVGLLLFLVCANMAGLLLARASGRTRELAVRHALGANRFRLIRQLLVDSVLLAMLGGLVGLVAARWSGALLMAFMPSLAVPIDVDAGLSARVALFTFGLSLLAGVVLGMRCRRGRPAGSRCARRCRRAPARRWPGGEAGCARAWSWRRWRWRSSSWSPRRSSCNRCAPPAGWTPASRPARD